MNEYNSMVGLALDLIAKNLREQSKLNRGFALVSILTTGYILVLHKKIERLSDEVKELKQTMEE